MTTYSLSLFRTFLEKRPIGLPDDMFRMGKDNYFELQISFADEVEIEQATLVYGKMVWAYRQAAMEFEHTYAEEKKEHIFKKFLTRTLQEKWDAFKQTGGDIHNFRNPAVYENFFEPEEDLAVEEALVESEHIVRDYLDGLAKGELAIEFKRILEKYQKEQEKIEEKIEELRMLIPERGDKWDEEMSEEALFFERGLADIEERPTIKKVQEKIDWYRGQIEVGNT